MFLLLFLVLFAGSLAQEYIDYGDPTYSKDHETVAIDTRKINLTPSKYSSSTYAKPNLQPNKRPLLQPTNRQRLTNAKPSTDNGSKYPREKPTSIPISLVPGGIGTRISSCKASDGESGSCVKADQCTTTEEVFQINKRVKENTEEPCQDPTKVCCKSSETVTPDYVDTLEYEETPSSTEASKSGKTPDYTDSEEAPVSDKAPNSGTTQNVQAEVLCGISNPNGVGTRTKWSGDEKQAKFGEFPWTLQLLDMNKNNSHVCGGVLVHPQLVLTAAHCLLAKPGELEPLLLVRAGEWDRSTISEELPHQDREVTSNTTHEEFVLVGLFNDIALLSLSLPFELAPNVGVVCLPLLNDTMVPEHYTTCLSSGWGKEASDQELQNTLKKVELRIVDNLRCTKRVRKTIQGSHFVLHEHTFCAGGDGQDNCEGDGGAPLVCPMPNHPGHSMLSGIVSWTESCHGRRVPGVYTDVHKLGKWITDTAFVVATTLTLDIDLSDYQF